MSPRMEMDALSALRWLIEAGADEAVREEPINRLAASRPTPSTNGTSSLPYGNTRGSGSVPAPSTPLFQQGEQRASPATDGDNIGHAIDVAASCRTLAELKAALESYEGSQLKKNATKTVFADGNPESRILFIGEAPGREEDRAGLPFVGRAGKLLDLMMAAIGLDRSSAYIINVLPWRPPENRNPDPTEVAQCIPFLRRHIELAAPEILILLGAVPVRHVLGLAEGIMRNRGRRMEYRVGDRMIPVMPTFHPAYLLRQPQHKKLAWRDLQLVAERIEAMKLR